MKCLGNVSVHFMYSLRSVEERMRNVNEKKNFNCMENVTNVFWTHFTERLGRVHGVYIQNY